METAIRIDNLRVDYGDTKVLCGIDAEIKKGEIAVILGGSGCGKSTLLKTITGLIKPREGHVEILGVNTATLDGEHQSKLATRLGVMFQYGALLNSLTVGENIALPLEMHTDLPRAQIDQIVSLRLDSVSLGGTQNRMPSELSGGMRKRVALAMASSRNPLLRRTQRRNRPVTAAEIDELLLTQSSIGCHDRYCNARAIEHERLDGRLHTRWRPSRIFHRWKLNAQHRIVYPFSSWRNITVIKSIIAAIRETA